MRTAIRILAASLAIGAATPLASAQAISPYMPATNGTSLGDQLNPFSPYNYSSLGWYGGAYYGYAQVLKGYSQVIQAQEYARILREQAMQAKIDTARKRFDYDLYIRANTPTFADEQQRLARATLKRVQIASQPAEIASGKSQNILLDDIRMFGLKRANVDPFPFNEEGLSHINVTGKRYSLGMLRDGPKLQWPTALLDLVSPEVRGAIERQTETVLANALQGNVDKVMLDDLNSRMTDIRNQLRKVIGDIPSSRYLDADRFLTEFQEARLGIGEGQAQTQARFLQYIKGGRTMQEIVDYMITNGLRFAPASFSDEAAYRALHTALIAFDMALNAEAPRTAAERKEPPPEKQ
jgi:hypothetical protein